NCPNLSSITIGKKVESIGESAFSGCYSLTNITIKTTKNITESIAVNAFDGCLVSYLFYETTEFTLISFDGFQNKVQAIKFNISNSKSIRKIQEITSLPSLSHFTKLKYIIIQNINDLTIPESFAKGDDIEIFIANNIKYIDPYAFKDCSISKFTYLGTDKLEGNFLKNAKSCQEVITSSEYNYNKIGGKAINLKFNKVTGKYEKPNNNIGKIIGIVVGVLAALIIIGVIGFIIYKRKSAKKADNSNIDEEENNIVAENP
ncbi:regulation of response to stimulus, partial [Trichomonas vaginalis G3]